MGGLGETGDERRRHRAHDQGDSRRNGPKTSPERREAGDHLQVLGHEQEDACDGEDAQTIDRHGDRDDTESEQVDVNQRTVQAALSSEEHVPSN